MPVPATIGQERFNLTDMQIGDYIACEYTASTGACGTFANLGSATKAEIPPVTGSATPDGKFYFIKVDKGLLVADRVVQHSISWDALNAGMFIEGKVHTFGDLTCLVRSLSGGVAFADANGNKSTVYTEFGTFPTNNEYRRYIVNSDLSEDSKILFNNYYYSWCKDTPMNGLNTATSGHRVVCKESMFSYTVSSDVSTFYCFRPVLEYNESGSSLW